MKHLWLALALVAAPALYGIEVTFEKQSSSDNACRLHLSASIAEPDCDQQAWYALCKVRASLEQQGDRQYETPTAPITAVLDELAQIDLINADAIDVPHKPIPVMELTFESTANTPQSQRIEKTLITIKNKTSELLRPVASIHQIITILEFARTELEQLEQSISK